MYYKNYNNHVYFYLKARFETMMHIVYLSEKIIRTALLFVQ